MCVCVCSRVFQHLCLMRKKLTPRTPPDINTSWFRTNWNHIAFEAKIQKKQTDGQCSDSCLVYGGSRAVYSYFPLSPHIIKTIFVFLFNYSIIICNNRSPQCHTGDFTDCDYLLIAAFVRYGITSQDTCVEHTQYSGASITFLCISASTNETFSKREWVANVVWMIK